MSRQHVKVLINDAMGRWQVGEIGVVEANDFDKYDYKVKFPGTTKTKVFGKPVKCVRVYYFYAREVEVVK